MLGVARELLPVAIADGVGAGILSPSIAFPAICKRKQREYVNAFTERARMFLIDVEV